MKRVALIVTLLFLGVGVSLWVAQNYVTRWEPRLRSELEKRAYAALGVRIHIEDISVSFIHQVALKGVEVWDTRQQPEALLFRAKEVALTASLIDLPRAILHRNPLEVIGKITIDTPVATLSSEGIGPWRMKKKASTSSTPLWFSVEWDHGTFQWKDAQAPHGAWTLYQSNGFFRIRGPHIDATARGTLEQAENVDVHLATFGHRWNAQARLFGGNIPGTLAAAERWTHRPLLPPNWKSQGHFDFDVQCGGRWPVTSGAQPPSLIREARVSLSQAQLEIPNAPPVQLNGALILKEGRADFSSFSLKAENTLFKITGHALPFALPAQLDLEAVSSKADLETLSRYIAPDSGNPILQGAGSLNVSLKGALLRPALAIQAKVPQGQMGRWPFQNAVLQINRQDNRWQIGTATLRLCDGTVTLKGTHAH